MHGTSMHPCMVFIGLVISIYGTEFNPLLDWGQRTINGTGVTQHCLLGVWCANVAAKPSDISVGTI
jgi:hypothetical protein